jgi:hypothetical protein
LPSRWQPESDLGSLRPERTSPATVVAGEPATGGAAGFGSSAITGGPVYPTTYRAGQVIVLDPVGAVYAGIGAGYLRSYVQ